MESLDKRELERLAIEERRKYQREYYKKNRDKILEYQRNWREKNKDKVKEYNKRAWERKALKRLEEERSDLKG